MKAINIGTRYEIYNDTLKTYDQLPAQVYTVCFDKMTGFYLSQHTDIEISEKVYGVHEDKVEKVLRSFAAFDRNLGVILSGDKGIGKSLFAKMLSIRAVQNGMPVIIVDRFVPGIAAYIEAIEQEVMVLFDEFDKTFGEISTGDNEANPQAGLLSLFDGIAQGKKLFVITCNQLRSLNDYLVNRPGRFHYHFRFDYPSDEEIREYLGDKLNPEFMGEVEKVVAFSKRVDLNYDCLRAIAFELNTGETFDRAINDLNIINMQNEKYNITVYLTNGKRYTRKEWYMDLFNKEASESIWMYSETGEDDLRMEFDVENCVFDGARNATIVDGADVRLSWDEPDKRSGDEWLPQYVMISRSKAKSYHYGAV